MKRIIIFLLIIVSQFFNVVVANNIEVIERECLNNTSSTAGMITCTQQAKKMWQKEMEKYYSLLFDEIPQPNRKNLQNSQKYWLNYQSEQAKLTNELLDEQKGTMYLNVRENLQKQTAKTRAIELRELYNNYVD